MKWIWAALVAALLAGLCVFALTGCGGGGKEERQVPFEARYVRTNGYDADATHPQTTFICSRASLDAYLTAAGATYDTTELVDLASFYDDAWFEEHMLLVVVLEERSGSIWHEVTAVHEFPGHSIDISRYEPPVLTMDMAQWHIVVELPAGSFQEGDGIQVVFTDWEAIDQKH